MKELSGSPIELPSLWGTRVRTESLLMTLQLGSAESNRFGLKGCLFLMLHQAMTE